MSSLCGKIVKASLEKLWPCATFNNAQRGCLSEASLSALTCETPTCRPASVLISAAPYVTMVMCESRIRGPAGEAVKIDASMRAKLEKDRQRNASPERPWRGVEVDGRWSAAGYRSHTRINTHRPDPARAAASRFEEEHSNTRTEHEQQVNANKNNNNKNEASPTKLNAPHQRGRPPPPHPRRRAGCGAQLLGVLGQALAGECLEDKTRTGPMLNLHVPSSSSSSSTCQPPHRPPPSPTNVQYTIR